MIVDHMIQRLLKALGIKLPAPPPVEPVIDPNNVYVRLRLAMDRAGSTPIRLSPIPGSLGNIDSFAGTLEEFRKSLVEVNSILKENTHIDNGRFYGKRLRSVKLDQFLFVEDGYYATDVTQRIMAVSDQIDVYYELMKNADEAMYGVMEHNHRQLYSYTETLIVFLDALIHHFGE